MFLAESKIETTSWQAPVKGLQPALSIPPVIDNLWEWRRPASMPSRCVSTFASPTADLAIQRVGIGGSAAKVYRIALPVGARIAQLTSRRAGGFDPSDARFHPDVHDLSQILLRSLGRDWPARRLRGKARPGLLWVPCLFKEEVEALFCHVPELRRARERMWAAITYWEDVRLVETLDRFPDPRGEIFFESHEGYWREPIKSPTAAVKRRRPGLLTRLLHDGAVPAHIGE